MVFCDSADNDRGMTIDDLVVPNYIDGKAIAG